MRNWNWWLGISATLAVTAGLLAFGAQQAALLVALGAAGGWALWGLAATRAALEAPDRDGQRRLAARVRLGLARFLESHVAEARQVRAQLEQLKGLLGDAAERLGTTFAAMHALAERQERIARSAVGGAGPVAVQAAANEDGKAGDEHAGAPARAVALDELEQVTRDLERTVGEAVTALQFQDIATQLVGHTVERIDALERLAGRLEGLPDATADDLGRVIAEAQPARRTSPVAQTKLAQGAVELF